MNEKDLRDALDWAMSEEEYIKKYGQDAKFHFDWDKQAKNTDDALDSIITISKEVAALKEARAYPIKLKF